MGRAHKVLRMVFLLAMVTGAMGEDCFDPKDDKDKVRPAGPSTPVDLIKKNNNNCGGKGQECCINRTPCKSELTCTGTTCVKPDPAPQP
jgi:hypothetical protein